MRSDGQDFPFFDANFRIGAAMTPDKIIMPQPRSIADILGAMDGYGIARALVWHAATRDASVPTGNKLLAELLQKDDSGRLVGCWGFLPDCEERDLAAEPLFKAMCASPVRALRCWPAYHRFLLNRETCGRTLAGMQERAIPLFVETPSPNDWQTLYNLLRDFPNLVVIVTNTGLWGVDRFLRPLFESYPNVHVETSECMLASGINVLAKKYGADRILFGSGFPVYHAGGAMLTIKHADAPEAARRAMAGATLEKIIKNAQLD